MPAALFLTGCGESTPTPTPPPAAPVATEGDTLPIMKNASGKSGKTTDEDTSHSLRSKNRRKD